jgi:sugar lactone lactonase YvrE
MILIKTTLSIIIAGILLSVNVNAQIIETFAGNGQPGNTGDGGLAIDAKINYPVGGVFDKNGNFYFTSGSVGNSIRKVSPSGIITTIAGNGNSSFSGDGGPAILAALNNPQAVTIDSIGNLYIADAGNNRIRKVDASTGIITTIAGTGVASFSGDNGPASLATIYDPLDLCIDTKGFLYIADAFNFRIRRINLLTGIIITFAGNGNAGYTGDGGLADTSSIGRVIGICTDDAGDLFIASELARLYKVDTNGIFKTIAGNGIFGSSGDGGYAINAQVNPCKVTLDRFGNIFIADRSYNRIRKIDTLDMISTVVGDGNAGYSGDGGPANIAEINVPAGLVTDTCGNLYFADANNFRVRMVAFNPNCILPERINDHNEKIKIGVYPNPALQELCISSSNAVKEMRILNTIGQVLITQRNYSTKAVIDVSALGTGIYFIKVIDNSGAEVVKRFLKE